MNRTETHTDRLNVADNVQICLDALNLTDYFQAEGYLRYAKQNAISTLNQMHLLLPTHFARSKDNHCWQTNSSVMLRAGKLSGHIGNYHFSVPIRDIDSFTLNSVQKTHAEFRYPFRYVCLPEVFLAGFAKCGSSFLYSMLSTHPEIRRSAAKEPHLWDRSGTFIQGFENFVMYVTLYILDFSKLGNGLWVDGSPQTVYAWPYFPKQAKETNICLLPALIPAVLPKARFIVVMRNPVTALYSFFWFACTHRNGRVPKELLEFGPDVFHDRLVTKIKAFDTCRQSYSDAKCVLDIKNMNLRNYTDGARGRCGDVRLDVVIYYVHILKWLSILPRNHLYCLTLEELSSSPLVTMKGLWKFLGVNSNRKLRHLSAKALNQQQTVDYHHDHRFAMREDTKVLITEFMKPYNEKLAGLLGDKKYLWNTNS